MKSTMLLLFLSLTGTALFAQKKVNQKKPEKVAIAYYKALMVLDFTTAKEISTEEGKQFLGFIESMTELSDEEKAEARSKGEKEQKMLKKADCKVDGDKATCTVCCMNDPETGEQVQSEALLLRREGKLWYVHFDKSEMRGEPEEETDPTVIEPRIIQPEEIEPKQD